MNYKKKKELLKGLKEYEETRNSCIYESLKEKQNKTIWPSFEASKRSLDEQDQKNN